jgi:hypothetical protein
MPKSAPAVRWNKDVVAVSLAYPLDPFGIVPLRLAGLSG